MSATKYQERKSRLGPGNHIPYRFTKRRPPQIPINLHVRRGNIEDARLVEELQALPHLSVNVTFVSKSLAKSLGAPYIPSEGNKRRLSGTALTDYLNKIK